MFEALVTVIAAVAPPAANLGVLATGLLLGIRHGRVQRLLWVVE